MTYGIADFMWLLIIGWIIIFVIHQTIGGLLGLFYRRVQHKNEISVTLKQKA